MNVDDVELVSIEYAREDGLRARRSVYGDATVRGAIGEVSPERVLEVGWGSRTLPSECATSSEPKLSPPLPTSTSLIKSPFEGSLSATCANAIFVAERAV